MSLSQNRYPPLRDMHEMEPASVSDDRALIPSLRAAVPNATIRDATELASRDPGFDARNFGASALVRPADTAGVAALMKFCAERGIALVSGTTGIDGALTSRLADAARQIAVLRAANFSLGVAMLARLLREAASALPAWDLEIVEAHHGRKRDAPSGTALALGEAAAAARHTTLEAAAAFERGGERVDGSIGFAVIRGGDIVGEHQVMLIGQGERLELVHRATDRSIFARGALHAAHWLAGRPAGSRLSIAAVDE